MFRILSLLFVVLLVCNVIAFHIKQRNAGISIQSICKFFDFNEEFNLPSLYSSAILLISALLLRIIYNTIKSGKLAWLILSFTFLFLSLDELLSLHERIIPFTRNLLNLSGYFYFAWVVPYSIITAIIGFLYIPFLMRLPKKVRYLFITSGFIFVLGAVGIEAISARQFETFGGNTFEYFFYYTLEECLEIIGISLFIVSLLYYLAKHSSVTNQQVKLGRFVLHFF